MEAKIHETQKDRVDGSINRFVIECLFRKYFEEKKEIASPPPSAADRNDEGIAVQASS